MGVRISPWARRSSGSVAQQESTTSAGRRLRVQVPPDPPRRVRPAPVPGARLLSGWPPQGGLRVQLPCSPPTSNAALMFNSKHAGLPTRSCGCNSRAPLHTVSGRPVGLERRLAHGASWVRSPLSPLLVWRLRSATPLAASLERSCARRAGRSSWVLALKTNSPSRATCPSCPHRSAAEHRSRKPATPVRLRVGALIQTLPALVRAERRSPWD